MERDDPARWAAMQRGTERRRDGDRLFEGAPAMRAEVTVVGCAGAAVGTGHDGDSLY